MRVASRHRIKKPASVAASRRCLSVSGGGSYHRRSAFLNGYEEAARLGALLALFAYHRILKQLEGMVAAGVVMWRACAGENTVVYRACAAERGEGWRSRWLIQSALFAALLAWRRKQASACSGNRRGRRHNLRARVLSTGDRVLAASPPSREGGWTGILWDGIARRCQPSRLGEDETLFVDAQSFRLDNGATARDVVYSAGIWQRLNGISRTGIWRRTWRTCLAVLLWWKGDGRRR